VTDHRVIPSARIRLAPDVLLREEDDGFILYDIRRDVLYEGNDTGRQILTLCDGSRTVEEIMESLSVTSGLSPEEMSGYVGDFLDGLLDDGLAEPA
jgi:hypothetical protein